MATQSIFHTNIIQDSKKAEAFVTTLEKAASVADKIPRQKVSSRNLSKEEILKRFSLQEIDLSKYQNRIIWERDSNECIIFIQSTLDGVVSYDNEESKYELIETNNFSVVFVKKHDLLMLFWSDNQYKYSLDVYGGLTLDECVALIESIHELTD